MNSKNLFVENLQIYRVVRFELITKKLHLEQHYSYIITYDGLHILQLTAVEINIDEFFLADIS